MRRLIDATVASVRRIAADLRPVMLDDLGLIPAIEWLANDFTNRYGIDVARDIETGDAHFSPADDREFDVLRRIAAGQTITEIAAELCVSSKTVSTYKTRILEKMQIRSRAIARSCRNSRPPAGQSRHSPRCHTKSLLR
jgi:DNA-binding NarL/FixJ family response regulator